MKPTTINRRAGGLLVGMLAVAAIGGCGIPAASSSIFAPRYDYKRKSSEQSYYYLLKPRATPRSRRPSAAPAPTAPRPTEPDGHHPGVRPRTTDSPKPTDAFDDTPEEYDRHPSKWKQKLRVKYV